MICCCGYSGLHFCKTCHPCPRIRGKPALVMYSAMVCPSNCVTPVGINRAEPCPYMHGGETGFSPVSACSPVSRMGFSRQETDISEPRWSCLCRPSQNTPIIYARLSDRTGLSAGVVLPCMSDAVSGLGSDSRVLASTITRVQHGAWLSACGRLRLPRICWR